MNLFLSAFFIVSLTTAQEPSYADSLKAHMDTAQTKPFENTAFRVGEKLHFKVKWNYSFIFVPAGYATMHVKDTVRLNNRLCYKIEVTARSIPIIESLYKVKDTIRTYIDTEYGISWRFEKKTREGSYYRDLFIDYDHVNQTASVEEIRYKDEEATKVRWKKNYRSDILPLTQDILSSFYMMRARHIEPGYPFQIPNNSANKNYMLEIRVNPQEKTSVDAGKFKTFVLKPNIEGESIFNQEGSMKIWVTSDSSHIPIRMASSIRVGEVSVELVDYEGVVSNARIK